jgi:diguanylate cyclase (GGDEF)-like protein
MRVTLRIAFDGYNEMALKVCNYLHEMDGDIEVVGWVGESPPPEQLAGMDIPSGFADLDTLIREKGLDLLFSVRGEGAREGTGFDGKITDISEGSAENALLGYLASVQKAESDQLRRVLKNISTFCDSVQVIDAYTDPLPKLNQILDHSISLCEAELGFVLLPGELADELDLAVARGEDTARFLNKTIRIEGSVLEAVMDMGKSLLLKLAPEDLAADEFLREAQVSSLMAVPLQVGGRTVGVFLVGRRGDNDFLAYHLGVLTVAAAQASLALQISQLYGELETNTTRDGVSGLFNEGFFQSRLTEEVNRARRYSLNVGLLVLEVDEFDEYTRDNGRVVADLVLSDIGSIIQKTTRDVDVPARIGEGRFAILLPETRRLGALRLAERMRQVIGEYPFPTQDKKETEQLTACVGVSSYPANADTDTTLLQRATLAMQAAQAAGPGQVRLYSDDLRK